SVVSGLDQYMNSSAPFCRSAGQANANPEFGLVDYKLTQIDYVFHGDVALVPYVAETVYGRAKLVRLEFPRTDVQAYGDVAIIYTTYLYELESAPGQKETTAGHATEIFVKRNGAWLNSGWHLAANK